MMDARGTDLPLPEGFARLGIESWPQVLRCLPGRYTDYSTYTTLREAARAGLGGGASLFALVVTEAPVVVAHPKPRVVLAATDGMTIVRIVVFMVEGAQVERWTALATGDPLHIRGTLQSWAGKLQITSPTFIPDEFVGGVMPNYPSRRGIVSATVTIAATRYALARHLAAGAAGLAASFPGMTEAEILRDARLTAPSLEHLLNSVHRPNTAQEGEEALVEARRLAAFSVAWHAKRLRNTQEVEASRVAITSDQVRRIIAALPVTLTDDQRQAVREICTDLASHIPMRRILSGDVGSGKTITYMVPALAVRETGGLVVIMSPNTLLVDQFVAECRGVAGPDVPIVAVTSAMKRLPDLSANPILVGTTALLTRLATAQRVPSLLICDEQHKFAPNQRTRIAGAATNLLEATATPIPRSTALITHGAMDVSILRQSPVARNVFSRIVEGSGEARRWLFTQTRKIIDAGGQVAIIYPIVSDKNQERRSLAAAFKRWEAEFPGRVVMVHGAMKDAEKLDAIRRLKENRQAICVASTVLELGLTMPALKALVVVHPERYGVSQLHQLRGRVARHGGTGHFFMLLPAQVSDAAKTRLQLLERHSDGFTLAEEDARMRGYGDLVEKAERQHGVSHSALFVGVRLTPEDIVESDRRFIPGAKKEK